MKTLFTDMTEALGPDGQVAAAICVSFPQVFAIQGGHH